MHDEKRFGKKALGAGAIAYVNKQAVSRTIVEATHHVLEGGNHVSEGFSGQTETHRMRVPYFPNLAGVDLLTDSELDVFGNILEGPTTVDYARHDQRHNANLSS